MQKKYNYNPEIKEIPILNELAMVQCAIVGGWTNQQSGDKPRKPTDAK